MCLPQSNSSPSFSHNIIIFWHLHRDAPHKHAAPVWQVSWVLKERSMGDDKSEVLVSISVDGHILQWTIRKGFESTQLMKLKRMVTPKLQEKKTTKSKHAHGHVARVNPATLLGQGEAYISQHAPGMGFDFWPRDSNMWAQHMIVILSLASFPIHIMYTSTVPAWLSDEKLGGVVKARDKANLQIRVEWLGNFSSWLIDF